MILEIVLLMALHSPPAEEVELMPIEEVVTEPEDRCTVAPETAECRDTNTTPSPPPSELPGPLAR